MACEEKENDRKSSVDNKIEEKLLESREIYLWGAVDDESAEKIVKRIIYLDEAGKGDIKLFLNSPGGVISSGLAIYDAMQAAKSDISTICMGQAASMGAVILCAGKKGKRLIWPNARVMIHQPLISSAIYGPATDIQIQAEEMLHIRSRLNAILVRHSGKSMDVIERDTDRDKFMSAKEAVEYGLADKIVE